MSGDPRNSAMLGLNAFLADVEKRALVMAELSTRDREEALEIVQETMLAFVRRYATKPQTEWLPLFFRVLQNRIRDWGRQQRVRRRWRVWLSAGHDGQDAIQDYPDPSIRRPEDLVGTAQDIDRLMCCLENLAVRQREAVLLRIWQGLDVRDTALAMRCSGGSVKTHLSRALSALRQCLKDGS